MARIKEIYPAKDGVVRSVLIKTHDGTFERRPVLRLAPVLLSVSNLKTRPALSAPQTRFKNLSEKIGQYNLAKSAVKLCRSVFER